MVTYYCNDENDDGRFTTAWFYVNTNINEEEYNTELKRMIVNFFLSGNNVTTKNRFNVEQMVSNMNDTVLKKELSQKLKTNKSKANFAHHKKQVE